MSKFKEQKFADSYEDESFSHSGEGNEEFLQYNDTIQENEDENEYMSESNIQSEDDYDITEREMPGDKEKSDKMKEEYKTVKEVSGFENRKERMKGQSEEFSGEEDVEDDDDDDEDEDQNYQNSISRDLQNDKKKTKDKISEEIASEREIQELEKANNKKPDNPAFSISSQEDRFPSKRSTKKEIQYDQSQDEEEEDELNGILKPGTPSKNMEITEHSRPGTSSKITEPVSQRSIKNQNSQNIEKPKMVSTSAGNNPEPQEQPQRTPHEQYLSTLDIKQLGRYNFLIEKNIGIRSELIKVASQLDMLVQAEKGDKLNVFY